MLSRTNLGALLFCMAALAGCSSPPEMHYYTLRPEAVLAAPQPGSFDNHGARNLLSPELRFDAHGPVILVDHFAIDDAYATDRIAYREGDHELGYDPYSLWAGPPVTQVEDAVRDVLAQSGLFADVRQPAPATGARSSVDLVVTGRVARLEEVDKDEDHWEAALDLQLYLLDGKTREVLASKRFAASEPASKRNPRAVVAALSGMLGKAVAGFLADSKPAIEAHKPRGS